MPFGGAREKTAFRCQVCKGKDTPQKAEAALYRQIQQPPIQSRQTPPIDTSKTRIKRHDRRFRQKCQIRNDPYIPHILTQPNRFEPPIDMSNRHCRRIRHTFSVRLDRNNR